ncbi:glycosyltransferase family 1 protein [Balneolaceae bacterium YR4-1]|uniref:Glycosyltransferase family 1 protein n=1 Tax=Halalkalibaculum roseum TaxID=2709311 RepID=A0A6M1ST07_9BACT|nr:glycosyltransferase [Halalkalibaculum roseum]NGP75922.1 glycosyltransferase family 1 protein [Halalkalibaculum roseum]
MKTLLFLNGSEGCQTGIEDGFKYLLGIDKISELEWFYYTDYANKHTNGKALNEMLKRAETFQPDLVVFFHLGDFQIEKKFLIKLKNIDSKPIIVYDEGDMYGGLAKPIKPQMELIMRHSEVVSIRGLGKFHKQVKKYNEKVIYTPHHNDIHRFDDKENVFKERDHDIVLIGNKVKSRMFNFIRRLPGAKERENFAEMMDAEFPDQFKIYGNGWDSLGTNQGPVDFYKQHEIYENTWITVAYEHYPSIPYYFSNRLPMALMNGSLYVSHYHEGYEKMFPDTDFIFFFKNNDEAIDIIKYILSLGKEELICRSEKARDFALRQYTPQVIWSNFLKNVLSILN